MGKFRWEKIDGLDGIYAYYNGEELGYIEYYKKWKKWVWNQGEDIIMSSSCIKNVLDKLRELESKSD